MWSTTLGPIPVAKTLIEPLPEKLEIDRGFEGFQQITVRAKQFEMIIQAEKADWIRGVLTFPVSE